MSMDYGPFSIQVSMYYCLSLLPNQAKEKSFISSLLWLFSCAKPKTHLFIGTKNKMVTKISFFIHRKCRLGQINDSSFKLTVCELEKSLTLSTCRLF